ncbi:DapH/DapD/GlmU-related protein [Phenylobacterium sp. VNQ135]|uniref:DapH/DapD/GlmU-related protein n=1 Tax=Phenylobacterium sp. VNQ135 TaxID=3400922 RepID=UPI003C031A42
MIHDTAFIHPKAHVQDATVGARTKVWQFASVTGGTVLGEDCSVSPFAMLHGPRFGDRCVISGGVMMGPGFVLGDEVFVGPNVTLANDMWPRADKTGWDVEMLRDGRCVAVKVGNRVGIGAGAVILPGVSIGDDCFIAAGAVADRSVPAGHLFRRDGSMVPVNPAWTKRRMRAA